jgi:hypothetical protein
MNAWLVVRIGDLNLGHFARSSFYEKIDKLSLSRVG